MRAAEIRGRRILADIDDAFANLAGAREMLEQSIAVTVADGLGTMRPPSRQAAE